MRAILVLLLALSLALAGCADDADDAGGDTTTDPTDDGAGTGAGNDTSDGNETGAGNETGDANETGDTNETGEGNETGDIEPVLEPVEVVNTTFDFASGETGAAGTSETFDVPEGYETLHLELSATEGATALNVNGKVQIANPDGEVVYDGIPATGESQMEMVAAVPGTWTITYTGAANVEVSIVGIVYPADSDDAAAQDDHAGH